MSSEDSKKRVPEDMSSGPSMRRDYDSVDDFEHVGHEGSSSAQESERVEDHPEKADKDDERGESRPVPATPPPSADFEKCEAMARTADPFQGVPERTVPSTMVDPKAMTMAFMDTERSYAPVHEPPSLLDEEIRPPTPKKLEDNATTILEPSKPLTQKPLLMMDTEAKTETLLADFEKPSVVPPPLSHEQIDLLGDEEKITDEKTGTEKEPIPARTSSGAAGLQDSHPSEFLEKIESSVLPVPEKSPSIDFLTGDVGAKESKNDNLMDDDSWNIVDRKEDKVEELAAPSKPLPPLPKEADVESDKSSNLDRFEMSHDFILGESNATRSIKGQSGAETGDSEFESEPEPSPAKPPLRAPEKPQDTEIKERSRYVPQQPSKKVEDIEIAPKQIFRDMGLDAWFNPDRLNPKVAALIYWRDPKKSGIVFGATLVVLLSLAYFSVISVFAYSSLLVLTGMAVYRAGYKTILQAIRKTTDEHPFKDVLEVELPLPTDKVHEVADVVVAHVSATFSELRRLFLVEDFVDSLKFGVLLWCLTYVGSWFNGMTLVIMGVVALFTLPKVYETNKPQIDQNLALVQGKINELTAKVKAAIPLGKKAEPTKEE